MTSDFYSYTAKSPPGAKGIVEIWRWMPAWINLFSIPVALATGNLLAAWFAFAAAIGFAFYIHERDFRE